MLPPSDGSDHGDGGLRPAEVPQLLVLRRQLPDDELPQLVPLQTGGQLMRRVAVVTVVVLAVMASGGTATLVGALVGLAAGGAVWWAAKGRRA